MNPLRHFEKFKLSDRSFFGPRNGQVCVWGGEGGGEVGVPMLHWSFLKLCALRTYVC